MSQFKSKFRKFQKSGLSRELIWINSCKAIVSHELSQIKTFWDWIESNKKLSRTHVCCGPILWPETVQEKAESTSTEEEEVPPEDCFVSGSSAPRDFLRPNATACFPWVWCHQSFQRSRCVGEWRCMIFNSIWWCRSLIGCYLVAKETPARARAQEHCYPVPKGHMRNGLNTRQGTWPSLNPRWAGAPKLPRSDGRKEWGYAPLYAPFPPCNSVPKRRSMKRKKFKNSLKIISTLLRPFFAHVIIEITRGHRRSEGKIWRNTIFLQKGAINLEAIIGRRPRKKAIDGSLAALLLASEMTYLQQVGLYRGQQKAKMSFLKKKVFAYNFWTSKASEIIRAPSCSSRRDALQHIHVEVNAKIWPLVKDTWSHVVTQIGHVAYPLMQCGQIQKIGWESKPNKANL